MVEREDFRNSYSFAEARSAYSEIYLWHIRHGKERFEERFRDRDQFEDYRHRYFALLTTLIDPHNASANDMLRIAHEVRSGGMEWAYTEKTEKGHQLSNLASRIQELIQDRQELRTRDEVAEDLVTFRSLGEDGTALDGKRVEIPLGVNEVWNIATYLRYAHTAYRDVPENENLGGRVFLIQTNLEAAKSEHNLYAFKNARLLHVEVVDGENALVGLVSRGLLTVESVTLGE